MFYILSYKQFTIYSQLISQIQTIKPSQRFECHKSRFDTGGNDVTTDVQCRACVGSHMRRPQAHYNWQAW